MNYTKEEYEEMKSEIKISKHWDKDYIKKVIETALEVGHSICGVKTRKGTPCKNHPKENGRCSVPQHTGGAKKLKGNQNAKGNKGGGAPEKNKNARTHGGYETIWVEQLTQEEQAYVLNDEEIKVTKALDHHMRLIDVRINWMLERLKKLSDGDLELSTKEIKQEIKGEKGKKEIKKSYRSQSDVVDKTLNMIDKWQRTLTRMAKVKEEIKSGGGFDREKIDKFLSGSDIFGEVGEQTPDDLDIPDIPMPKDESEEDG